MKKDCGHSAPCGCEDTPLSTPPPCETGTPDCPEPDNCSETFRTECIVWMGDDLICNSTVVATAGDRMDIVFQRMIALFCGPQNPPLAGITLSTPLPGIEITDPVDATICIDRNNCFEDVLVELGAGAPTILFDWEDITGTPRVGETTMLIENGRSCILFTMDISGATPGSYNFDLNLTACGVTVPARVSLIIP